MSLFVAQVKVTGVEAGMTESEGDADRLGVWGRTGYTGVKCIRTIAK